MGLYLELNHLRNEMIQKNNAYILSILQALQNMYVNKAIVRTLQIGPQGIIGIN